MSQDPKQPSNDPEFFRVGGRGAGAPELGIEVGSRTTLLDAGGTVQPRSALGRYTIGEQQTDPLKRTDDTFVVPPPPKTGVITERQLPVSVPPVVNEAPAAEIGEDTAPQALVIEPTPVNPPSCCDEDRDSGAPQDTRWDNGLGERLLRELDQLKSASEQPPAIIIAQTDEPASAADDRVTDPLPHPNKVRRDRFTVPPLNRSHKLGAIIVAGIFAFGLVTTLSLRALRGPREAEARVEAPTPTQAPTLLPHCRLMGDLTLAAAARAGYTRVYLFQDQTPNPQTRICRP